MEHSLPHKGRATQTHQIFLVVAKKNMKKEEKKNVSVRKVKRSIGLVSKKKRNRSKNTVHTVLRIGRKSHKGRRKSLLEIDFFLLHVDLITQE